MTFWEYALLFGSVLLGAGVAMLVNPKDQRQLQLFLSFSGAYILGICVLDIMPTVFQSGVPHVGLYILLGFFIQLMLEQFSGGVEHGHIHVPHRQVKRYTMMVMIGLCVHAFIEGLPLGGHVHGHEGHAHHLLSSIILHKAPAAFALVLLLRKSGFKRQNILFLVLLFAMMSPLAARLTAWFNHQNQISADHIAMLNAVVIGSFLHIATTILFESDGSNHHSVPIPKLMAILVGVGIAILSVVL